MTQPYPGTDDKAGMITALKNGFSSGAGLRGFGEQRLWIAFALKFATPEIKGVHKAALEKGWKECTAEELNIHLVYFHLQPNQTLNLGMAKYDIDAAAVRSMTSSEFVLDDFVKATYTLLEAALEFVEQDIFGSGHDGTSRIYAANYRKILVQNLKYIEYLEREKGVRLLSEPIQWRGRVSSFVPDWASIQVDPQKDCFEKGPGPFEEAAEEAAEAARRFWEIVRS